MAHALSYQDHIQKSLTYLKKALKHLQVEVKVTRSKVLDGVRGLAALSVVAQHLISLFLGTSYPSYHWVDQAHYIVSFTPFAVIWSGSQAVMIFFILSGFALHRMLAVPTTYVRFASRRIIRLWIPFACSVIMAVLTIYIIGSNPIPGQSKWLNGMLGTHLSAKLIIENLAAIGDFDYAHLNPVIWSLIQEIRLSLIFPMIYYSTQQFYPWAVMIVSLLIQACSISAGEHLPHDDISYVSTFSYQAYFVLGALLSKYESAIYNVYEGISRNNKLLLLVIALFLYPNCVHLSNTYSTMIGASLFMVLALCDKNARILLNTGVSQWLGKISYSLYLTHVVVIFAMLNWLIPTIPLPLAVLVSMPLIFGVAVLIHKFVEVPAIRLSRRFASRTEFNSVADAAEPRRIVT